MRAEMDAAAFRVMVSPVPIVGSQSRDSVRGLRGGKGTMCVSGKGGILCAIVASVSLLDGW